MENWLHIICSQELSRSFTRYICMHLQNIYYVLCCVHLVSSETVAKTHAYTHTHMHTRTRTRSALHSMSPRCQDDSSYNTSHYRLFEAVVVVVAVAATTWSARTWEQSNSKTFAIYLMSFHIRLCYKWTRLTCVCRLNTNARIIINKIIYNTNQRMVWKKRMKCWTYYT